jgi:hypothetical protein
MQLLLASLASAETMLGGAVDLAGGVCAGDPCSNAGFGLRQAEGDLRTEGEHAAFEVQADLAAQLTGDGLFIPYFAPERLVGEGFGERWRVSGGVFQGPYRIESVDPWRNPFVTPSLVSARVPGAIVGGDAELGSPVASVEVFGGVLPATVNVFDLDQFSANGLPFIGGLHGRVDIAVVSLSGGAWFGGSPASPGFGGAEIGGRMDLLVVGAYADFTGDFAGHGAGLLGAEIWPNGLFSPGSRLEFDSERGFGFAVGASSTIADLLRLKAEASYQDGGAGVYLEVGIYSAWPDDDVHHPRARQKSVRKAGSGG